jgi:hypothetical protein
VQAGAESKKKDRKKERTRKGEARAGGGKPA